MTAQLLMGKPVADALLAPLPARIARVSDGRGRLPTLAVLRFGDDPDTAIYTRSLLRNCRTNGLLGLDRHFTGDVSEDEAIAAVRTAGLDSAIDAIIIQTPLPGHIRLSALTPVLPPAKDVDGLTVENAGLLARGQARFVPATARALLLLAQASELPLAGARAVVVGRSNVVGIPTALLLLKANATVTVCHRSTRDLAEELRRADLVVAAAGQPGTITGDMLRPGAVVLDAGTTFTDGALRGDVDEASALAVASILTPVPGGVGPVTTAVLLEAVVSAAEQSILYQT